MTLLQQLENATCGATDEADRKQRAGASWRGYAFTLAGLNLVIPRTADIQIAPAREVQPLPMCRDWVVGMMTVGDIGGGEVFSVIDLAKFLRRDAGNAVHTIAGGASLILVSGQAFNVGLQVNGRISVRVFYDALDGDSNSDSDYDAAQHSSENGNPPTTTHPDTAIAPFITTSFPHGAQTWHVLNIKALTQSADFIAIARPN